MSEAKETPQKTEAKPPAATDHKNPAAVSAKSSSAPQKPESGAPLKPEPKPLLKLPPKIKQRIADMKDLAIAIDSFEDIFSDFDPREYAKRDISDDFLRELKKRFRETSRGQFEVTFHAPKALHDENIEKIVVQRLKQLFRTTAAQHKKDIAFLRLRGSLYIGLGIFLLLGLSFMALNKVLPDFKMRLLEVIFLPLGWFGIWEGFGKVVDIPWKLDYEFNFNQKMARANFQFKFLE